MENGIYTITRIEGEYAYITPQDSPADELFIAMALLPPDVDVGDKLKLENFEFTVI
ncbi:MAG: hypothetical protein IJY23_07270 [Clostridia bacterium]|nr:hypothetical protein [Clostridia bacterium]